MRQLLRSTIAVTAAMLLAACGSGGDGTATSPAAAPAASSAQPSPSAAKTPATTTDWVINPTVADVDEGIDIAITFPAAPADDPMVAAAIKARTDAGLPEGTWLLATVRNDSDGTTSLQTATAVTRERKQVKLDSGLLLLNEISEIKPDAYTDAVSALNGKLSDLQGYDIKPGTDATVILATPEAVTSVVDLYLSVGGSEVLALTGAQASASAAAASSEAAAPVDQPAGQAPSPGAGGKEIAAALGCSGYKAKKAGTDAAGVTPISIGTCTLADVKYEITAYGSGPDRDKSLAVAAEFIKQLKLEMNFGVGDWYVVAVSANLNDGTDLFLADPMVDAIKAVGGEITDLS